MTSIRYARRGGFVSLAALIVLLPAAVAAAHEDPGPVPVPLDRSAALAADVAIIAAETGWSRDATRRHLRDQEAFGDLQDEIMARFAGTFAGAEFASAPGTRSYLRFTGPVPPAAAALADASALNVGLTGGRTYSEMELHARVDAITAFLVDAGYRATAVAVLPTGGIEASVTTGDVGVVGLPPALSDGVRVSYVGHEVAGYHHTYGGAQVSGSDGCTSGFTVASLINGTQGVTTAGHCSGIDTYFEPQSNNFYGTHFQDQHLGASGDVEWHTTEHGEHAVYYANVSDVREVNSVETSAAANNWYCVYSRMLHYRACDQVYATTVAVSADGVWVSNLVAMDDMHTIDGDSGGPWSMVTEAAGTVSGWGWFGLANRGTWSKAWSFDSAIDVAVLTQ